MVSLFDSIHRLNSYKHTICSKFVPGSTFFLHSVKQKWTLGYSANTVASQEPPPKPTCRTLPHSIERWLYLQAIY